MCMYLVVICAWAIAGGFDIVEDGVTDGGLVRNLESISISI
jgi:hypothetical protein